MYVYNRFYQLNNPYRKIGSKHQATTMERFEFVTNLKLYSNIILIKLVKSQIVKV